MAEMTTTPVAIFRGDAVSILATGRVATTLTAGGSAQTIGVANNYVAALAANDGADVWVYDDPDTVFEIQSDGTTDPTLATSQLGIGATADLLLTSGNTSSGQSQHELDYQTINTTTNQPLRIIGFYNIAGNDMALAHGRYLVTLNMHTFEKRKGV
jgi:hypothetical protein